MLRFFRINDPYRLLGLLVLTFILWLPMLLDPPGITLPELETVVVGEKVAEGFRPYSEIIDDTAPMASWYYGLCDWVLGRSYTARHIVAILIIFLQSAFWGVSLINKKVFTENSYVPSFIFSLLALTSFDFFTLHADVAAFGFSLLMLNNVFKEIEFGGQRDDTVFNLGIFVGVASLFNYSFIVFLPGIILILLLFTTNRFRSYLLLIMGAILPHLAVGLYYFVSDDLGQLWSYWYSSWFASHRDSWLPISDLLLLAAFPILYVVLSFFFLNRLARLTKYQSQTLQATNLWFVICIVQIWLAPDRRPQSLIVLIPSASIMISHFLLMIRRLRYANMNTWILLLGIMAFSYLSRYMLLPGVEFNKIMVGQSRVPSKGEKILDIDGGLSSYLENTIAPPFVNRRLSNQILSEPDYYENVLLIDRLFKEDPPALIYDEHHQLEAYFERIPYLGNQYSRTDSGYRRKQRTSS